jgi:hypothetical protein
MCTCSYLWVHSDAIKKTELGNSGKTPKWQEIKMEKCKFSIDHGLQKRHSWWSINKRAEF